MSNRPGLCWSCNKREDCKDFKKDSNVIVNKCGRYRTEVYLGDWKQKVIGEWVNSK